MKDISAVERLLRALPRGKTLHNYIVPGLSSTALASFELGGMLRLFEMTRDQEYYVTPHNHRFNFLCLVLEGQVMNTTFSVREAHETNADHVTLIYDKNKRGVRYNMDEMQYCIASQHSEVHSKGDWYAMDHREYHSINFARHTKVLFIEQEPETEESRVLLPYVNGRICSTFLWADWMMSMEVK